MATVALTRVTKAGTLQYSLEEDGLADVIHTVLQNEILELSEKAFWHLVDIRLNTPKGISVKTNARGKEYAEIIDLNDKPTIVERWTEQCLVEQLFLELVTTKLIVSHDGNCGITVHKYYNQALALRKWILFTRPAPEFIVNLSNLSTRVIAELKVLQNTQDVLKQAVGRIFENIDSEQYHRSIASLLKVRLEK
jgi:hypothetical protein